MSIWSKDQHFVPQAYLRLFSHNQANIWVYDSVNKSIKSQRIKDTGFIKWFYLSRLHPAPFEIPEVSRLEGQAKAITLKIEARQVVTPVELGQLLNFIVFQFLRTPASRKRAESALNLFWQGLRKSYHAANLEEKRKAEEIAASFLDDQKMPITPQSFLENDANVAMPTEFFPQTIPILGQGLMEKLADQGWEFLSAEDNEFLTSDDPFSLAGEDEGSHGFSIGKDVYKTIPLSKRICMVIGGDKRPIIIKKMLPWAVKVINLNMANLADRYVYASNEKLLREVIIDLPKFKENPDAFTFSQDSQADPSA